MSVRVKWGGISYALGMIIAPALRVLMESLSNKLG